MYDDVKDFDMGIKPLECWWFCRFVKKCGCKGLDLRCGMTHRATFKVHGGVFFIFWDIEFEDEFVGASGRCYNLDSRAHKSMGRDAVGRSLLIIQKSGRVKHVMARIFALQLQDNLGHGWIREPDQKGDSDEHGGWVVFGLWHAKIYVVAEVEGRVLEVIGGGHGCCVGPRHAILEVGAVSKLVFWQGA